MSANQKLKAEITRCADVLKIKTYSIDGKVELDLFVMRTGIENYFVVFNNLKKCCEQKNMRDIFSEEDIIDLLLASVFSSGEMARELIEFCQKKYQVGTISKIFYTERESAPKPYYIIVDLVRCQRIKSAKYPEVLILAMIYFVVPKNRQCVIPLCSEVGTLLYEKQHSRTD